MIVPKILFRYVPMSTYPPTIFIVLAADVGTYWLNVSIGCDLSCGHTWGYAIGVTSPLATNGSMHRASLTKRLIFFGTSLVSMLGWANIQAEYGPKNILRWIGQWLWQLRHNLTANSSVPISLQCQRTYSQFSHAHSRGLASGSDTCSHKITADSSLSTWLQHQLTYLWFSHAH